MSRRDAEGRFVKKSKFFKIVDPIGHNGIIYKEGINTDVLPFNPSGDCEPGGLYFASTDIFAFLDYGIDVYEVEPIGEVYENPGKPKKFKAHALKMKRIGEWKDVEVFKYMVENGADIHIDDDVILRYAACFGYFKIVKYLVEHGADVSAEDDFALRTASRYGYFEIVKFLVENGADIHANDDEALRNASASGYLEIVKYLVENGADIGAVNNYALTWVNTQEIKDYLKKIIIERNTKI